jgi:hypothetical protein
MAVEVDDGVAFDVENLRVEAIREEVVTFRHNPATSFSA